MAMENSQQRCIDLLCSITKIVHKEVSIISESSVSPATILKLQDDRKSVLQVAWVEADIVPIEDSIYVQGDRTDDGVLPQHLVVAEQALLERSI